MFDDDDRDNPANPLPTNDEAAEFYRVASHTLREAGYEHYEVRATTTSHIPPPSLPHTNPIQPIPPPYPTPPILKVSSYALPGRRSRHNSCYWASAPFLGLGLGAASFLEGERQTRPPTIEGYREWLLDEFEPSVDDVSVETRRGHGGVGGGGATEAGGDAAQDAAGEDGRRVARDESGRGGGGEQETKGGGGKEAEDMDDTDDTDDVVGRMLEVCMVKLRTSDGVDLGMLDRTFGALPSSTMTSGPCEVRYTPDRRATMIPSEGFKRRDTAVTHPLSRSSRLCPDPASRMLTTSTARPRLSRR